MLLKFDETCGVEGEIVEQGELVNIDDHLAKTLIGYGRAHEATKAEIAQAKKDQKETE